jgi:hypothetical protein
VNDFVFSNSIQAAAANSSQFGMAPLMINELAFA